MKFALGAAAAITGASAIIYLLLRPRKRQLDPGKQRVTPACLISSKDSNSGTSVPVTEENIAQNKIEQRESDPHTVNSDKNGFQTFNGHISAEDKSCNLGHDDAKCKLSPTEQDHGVVRDDTNGEVASSVECKTQNVDSSVPCCFDDKPCSEVHANCNNEVSTAVQNAYEECPSPVAKQTFEEALQSVNHTDIQEGIISSTAECEISECVSAVLDSEQRGSNLDCDSGANDSCVTSSSFSEEKDCTPMAHNLINASYSSTLEEESHQENDCFLENEPVTSSNVEEKDCASSVIESGFGKNMSSFSQLSANEKLQKLGKVNVETIPSLEGKSKMRDEIKELKELAESFTEDSIPTKSSITEKHEQCKAPLVELPVTEVSGTTELALDKHVEEFPKAELSGVPAESLASESSEAVEKEFKAGVQITSVSVGSPKINNIESSEIQIVSESDAVIRQLHTRDEALNIISTETEVCSQSEKLQTECAEVNAHIAEVPSPIDSQDCEEVTLQGLITNIMAKEELPVTEDSTTTKSSVTEKHEQREAGSPLVELPVTDVSGTTELALEKQVEESPKAELSGVPAESIACESSEAVEKEFKAGVQITSVSVESPKNNNIESSKIQIVNESDAVTQQLHTREEALNVISTDTEASSQSEKLQTECAHIAGMQSFNDSQDSEELASQDLVKNIIVKEELSATEDSTSTKSSITEKHEQGKSDSPLVELPVTDVSGTTELAQGKQVEESPKAELSGVPAESIACESSETVEKEFKAGVQITSVSVESPKINIIESSKIQIVNESDAVTQRLHTRDEALNILSTDNEMCSQSEKLQTECAENAQIAEVQSSIDSQDSEEVASQDLVTSIMVKEESAHDLKCNNMWSECVDNSPKNSVTEETFSIFQTGGKRVFGSDANSEKNALINRVELGKTDETCVDQQTNIKINETCALSSEQEPIPPTAYEDSSSLGKAPSICDSVSYSSLEKGGSEDTETGNIHGNSGLCFESQEKSTTTLNSSEPVPILSRDTSPSSASNSQRKKSYKDRVRNSHCSTSSADPPSSAKESVSEGDTCSDMDQVEKESCCVIADTHDDSVSSFVVTEKAATSFGSDAVEAVSSSSPVKEIVIVDNKVSTPSAKKDSGHNKSSKAKKEGVSKSSEISRNRSYKERVRNSRGNSASETVQNSQEEDVCSDNNGRNLKSTESSQSSSSEVGLETMFNPSAFPVSSQVQYIFYEFEIPQVLVGRLIGRKGAFVNKIKAATDATIIVGPHKNRKYKICSVEGSREQVNLALDMIREYFPPSRYPDVTLEQVYNRSPATAPPVDSTINSPAMQQIELAAGVVVEVRVSAVVSGNELWVQQPLHPSYSALQRLQSCMNINYGDGSTTPPLAPHISEGIICVAQINSQWYRCQVLSASEDFAILVLLDVGGTVSVPALELRQIRRDYMTLPFQAAQCLMHGVQPVSEEGWDETSAVVLEELVSGAILFATVVSYTQDGVPLVNLYRREQDEYVYLNERLVNLGHAKWIAPSPAS